MEQDTLHMMSMLAPDLLDEMARRAWVLERIATLQPIGRRALAMLWPACTRRWRGMISPPRMAP